MSLSHPVLEASTQGMGGVLEESGDTQKKILARILPQRRREIRRTHYKRQKEMASEKKPHEGQSAF